MKMTSDILEQSSFRDPSGFLFWRDGTLYRQINQLYQNNYQLLFDSGLYNELVDRELLVPHDEVEIEPPEPNAAYRIISTEHTSTRTRMIFGMISFSLLFFFSSIVLKSIS